MFCGLYKNQSALLCKKKKLTESETPSLSSFLLLF